MSIWFISHETPTKTITLHLLWYLFSISAMSWWNLSPCSSLTAPKFSGKKSKWEWGMWIFSDMFTSISRKFCSIVFTRWLQFLDFMFPKKLFITGFTDSQVCPSRSVKFFLKSQSNISCRICGPWKTPSLILALLSLGNYLFKKRKPTTFLSIPLTKFFMMSSFTCKGDSKIFWGSTSGFWATFIFPGSNFFRF